MAKLRRSKKIMYSILVFLFGVIAAIIILFNIPYSKAKKEFNSAVENEISKLNIISEVFSEEDIKNLPKPVQKYFIYCGYLGAAKMNYMKAEFNNVDFEMAPGKKIRINYIQYNFVNKPNRFAYIDSALSRRR